MEVLIFIAVSLLIILFIIALVHKFVFYAQAEDTMKVDELICKSMREQGHSENKIMQCADKNHFYYYPPNKSDQDCPDPNACLKEGCNKQLDGAMCDKGFSLQQSTEQAK